MKKILFPLISIIIFACILLTGCQGLGYTSGSGKIETTQYDLKDFDSVVVSSSFQFEIKQSGSYSVSTSCHENIIPFLDVYKSGSILIVRLKPGVHTNGDLNAVITLPELKRLEISGASRGSARDFKSAKDLDLEVSGASQLDINIEAGDTALEISGASRVTGNLKAQNTRLEVSGASRCELNGTGANSDLEVSGASTLSLKDLKLQNVNINVSGASTATINTDGILNLDVSGASTLNYYGNPTLSKVSVTGASRITSKS
jgi:hypothetical protein